jgi:hypothetical protein
MDRGTNQRLARKLPGIGCALRPLAHNLWRVFSHCLLYDRLTEGCAIVSIWPIWLNCRQSQRERVLVSSLIRLRGILLKPWRFPFCVFGMICFRITLRASSKTQEWLERSPSPNGLSFFLLENLFSVSPQAAIRFHKPTCFLSGLERVNHWELSHPDGDKHLINSDKRLRFTGMNR